MTNYDWLIHDCLNDWLTADGLTDGLLTDWLIDYWETADWLADSLTYQWTVIGWLTNQKFKLIGTWCIGIDLLNFCIYKHILKNNYLIKIKILKSHWRKILVQYIVCLKYWTQSNLSKWPPCVKWPPLSDHLESEVFCLF